MTLNLVSSPFLNPTGVIYGHFSLLSVPPRPLATIRTLILRLHTPVFHVNPRIRLPSPLSFLPLITYTEKRICRNVAFMALSYSQTLFSFFSVIFFISLNEIYFLREKERGDDRKRMCWGEGGFVSLIMAVGSCCWV